MNDNEIKFALNLKDDHVNKQEIASFLFIAFTFTFQLGAFWNYQVRIWNRVPYSVGSWTYSIAFYSSDLYPSTSYIQYILSQVILMFLTSLVFTIAMYRFLSSVMEKRHDLRLYIALTLISLTMLFTQIWAWKSLSLAPGGWLKKELDTLNTDGWKLGILPLPLNTSGSARYTFLNALLLICIVSGLISTLLTAIVLSKKIKQLEIKREELEKTSQKLPKTKSQIIGSFVFYVVLISFLVWTVTPVIYTFLLSLSDAADLRNKNVLPHNPLDNFFINYSSVIFVLNKNSSSFSSSFVISLQLGFFTALGGLSIALPAAYAISRFRFHGRNATQFLVLATQMFPGIILLIPQFIIWAKLGFFSGDRTIHFLGLKILVPGGDMKLLGLLLAYFVGAIAYNVWMMKGYFDTLPYDLEEAALIDGSSTIGAFLRIALPLSAPGMVAVSIFTFLGAWNEFALAQIFVGEKNQFSPLPLMFYEYQNTSAPDNPPYFELLSAFSILAALPIMIVFMSLQKLLTGGWTSGGVK